MKRDEYWNARLRTALEHLRPELRVARLAAIVIRLEQQLDAVIAPPSLPPSNGNELLRAAIERIASRNPPRKSTRRKNQKR